MPEQWQKDIEEILDNLEARPPNPPSSPQRRRPRRTGPSRLRGVSRLVAARLSRMTSGRLMLTAIALVLVGYALRLVSPLLFQYLVIAGVVLFVTAFVLSFQRPLRHPHKRWRGRVVEMHEPSLYERLRLWWRRNRPHRGRQ